MDASETCASCGKLAPPTGPEYDRALMLSGSPYCPKCLPDLTFDCHRCRKPLRLDDFENGCAMVLLGHKYCDHCLEEAVEKRRKSPEADPAVLDESGKKWKAHRAHPRVVPLEHCDLTMSRQGVLGFFGGNLVRLWVDVSMGGLRAILHGKYEVNDRLRGSMSYPPRKLKLEFQGIVRYVKTTDRYPGAMVVGIKFDAPSQELQTFIRDVLGARGNLTPSPRQQPPELRAG
jgi:hypothetical protein